MTVLDPVVHLGPDDLAHQLADDVRAGLGSRPLTVPSTYFYDARGSDLFDQITRLPEYYATRAERAILDARADEIATLTGARTLVELGSGTSEKTRLLLDALTRAGTLERFVAFDVDPAVLAEASASLAAERPGVEVEPVVGDFGRHLPLLPRHPGRLVAFLGSTIGNLDPAQRRRFLTDLRATLAPGDALLLGTDLVKDPARIEAAYDDAAGVTAEFNLNLLRVLARELDTTVDVEGFVHRAVWVPEQEWIEMRLVARGPQVLEVRDLDLRVELADGEEIRTEISAKFRREGVEAELAAAGLRLTHWWTDPAGDVALSLAVPEMIDQPQAQVVE